MDKAIEQIQQWSFLAQLRPEIEGFFLVTEDISCNSQYRIFTYHNSQTVRSFTVLYDHATKDFLARICVGLTEYCDVNYICTSLDDLEKLLITRMDTTLQDLMGYDNTRFESIFLEKKIVNWPYIGQLMQVVEGFQLYISPAAPVKIINGSYVIINYADFSCESDLVIYYNIFRDEFFGEVRLKRTPQVVTEFDAKTLEELKNQLTSFLHIVLKGLRKKIDGNVSNSMDN